ncbi:MAG TPA: PAS domain S-box protein [Candidatus Nanopelagicales bacterium]
MNDRQQGGEPGNPPEEPSVDREPRIGPDRVPDWLRLTFAASPVATGVVDETGTLLWVNDALAALTEHPAQALVGTQVSALVHPAARALVHESLARAWSDQHPTVRRLRGTEGEFIDATLVPLDATTTPGGAQLGLLQAVDVTQIVAARQSLQALADNALDIVALTDLHGVVTWVSPSVRTVLGRDPDAVIGQPLDSLAAPEDLLGLADALAGADPGSERATRTVRFRSSTGAYRYMAVSARPVDDPDTSARAAIAMRDITEELRAKRELARSEEQFRMAMLGAPEGMAVTDSQDRIVQVNPALCELLGASAPSLIGHRFREYIPEEDREQVDQWRQRLLRNTTAIERCQHRLAGPTSEVWVDHSVGVMRDELGNPQLFVHQFADRTAARRLQADLAYRASHDVQTGLANRESLRTRLGARLGQPAEAAEVVGVLFCDIDDLKPVNDRHGHLVGDAVIAAVAQRLERAVRRQDVVARMGGDEFVIVLDHCRSVEELSVVARNVHAAASHPVDTTAGTLDVTITVGAVLADASADTDAALARADDALYRAKRSGRNRICVEGLGEA